MLAGLTPSQYAKHLAGKAVTLAETLIPPATEDGGTSGPRHELPPLFDELVADHLNGEALEFPFRHLDVLRGHQRQSVHVRHLSIPLSERHKGAPLTRYPYPFSALYQTRPKQAKIAIYVL